MTWVHVPMGQFSCDFQISFSLYEKQSNWTKVDLKVSFIHDKYIKFTGFTLNMNYLENPAYSFKLPLLKSEFIIFLLGCLFSSFCGLLSMLMEKEKTFS